MLLSLWKPVCPECGYSLRGLTGSRCPECGIDFPIPERTFRRWAIRRIAWDRSTRDAPPFAYAKTLAAILVTPWRAARGLAIPDRWGRSVRWSAVHIALAFTASAVLANGQQALNWLVERIRPSSFDPPHMYMSDDAPAMRMIVWFSQSMLAWAIVLILPVGLGALLSLILPGRHRAAKLGGVKWSLYLSTLCAVMVAIWHGYYELFPPQAQAPFPFTFNYGIPISESPVTLMAVVYGVWWAIGMASNPYNRVRGIRAFFGFAVLFGGSWATVAWVLFPARALDALL